MKLLILGGTVFLGRHIVDCALARGHEVTMFNRGKQNADLFPQVEKLRGDRDGQLDALKGRRWDAVIDPSGYLPRVVRQSAELLADAVERYVFISTISVYADYKVNGIDESYPVAKVADETMEDIGKAYGALKALCEQAVERAVPGRVLQVRPGLIVGPNDPTDRFTYWPVRVARGGEMLAPVGPDFPVQAVDVRDLALWTVQMTEQKQTGVYNATGPDYPLTMGTLLDASSAESGSDARVTYVPESFLLEQKVAPWSELPLWLPGKDNAGILSVSVQKAIAAGLEFRPLRETVRDTLAWERTRPGETELPRRAGMKPAREAELLAAWHVRS
ncbi:MAG: epimerase [Chloroflexi bacterium]|nr:epimerase [Chloroflexota bacterium]